MAAPKGNKFAKGGARPNSGPKPLAIRQLCAKSFHERIPILNQIADAKKHSPRDRIAAIQVLAKVGVPERHEVGGIDGKAIIEVTYRKPEREKDSD